MPSVHSEGFPSVGFAARKSSADSPTMALSALFIAQVGALEHFDTLTFQMNLFISELRRIKGCVEIWWNVDLRNGLKGLNGARRGQMA